ncbi:molybdopterin oxidoreductase [Halobacteriales archaeon QS_1_68_20]|nr:MAG: molybdopterin oxidoreductase [Halobacteriales archaeon QS_1_68_20]
MSEEVVGSLTRRDAIKAGGAAVTAAGLSGCLSFLSETDDGPGGQLERDVVNTACWIGKQDCGAEAKTVGDRVVKFEGHPDDPTTGGALCPKGQAQIASVYDPYRVKTPLKRTNAKGQHGEWEQITWEQALDEVAADFREKLEDDPRRVFFQKGRGKAEHWHDDGWTAAVADGFGDEMEVYSHGAACSDTGQRMCETMFGTETNPEADLEHTEFLLGWGYNVVGGGGANLCQITWPRQIADAKERGMKLVAVDPQRRSSGHFADEWLPIEPGTDLALFLAMNHVLLREGYVDEEYFVRATNAPCLVAQEGPEEGHILRTEDADDPAEEWTWPRGELVYDEANDEVVPHEAAEQPALRGTYEVDGVTAKPGFQLYLDHMEAEQYTPEWAEEKTGIDAETIERLAIEWGEAANIGATKVINGHEIPYRPVATTSYHAVQMELGFMTAAAQFQTSMLVGAIDVVGSTRVRLAHEDGPNEKRHEWRKGAFHPENLTKEPRGPAMIQTAYFPFDSGGFPQTPLSLTQPDKYNIPYGPDEMAVIVQFANPVMSQPQMDTTIEAYTSLDTVVVVDPFVSETADLAADYVLPAATADKLEGPLYNYSGYGDIETIRNPAMDPMWESKPDGEIYIELAKALGIESEYVSALNDELGLTGAEYEMDPEAGLPEDGHEFLEKGLDRWARKKGKSLDWFRQGNVLTREWEVGGVGSRNRYAYLWGDRDEWGKYNPYSIKHEFYNETVYRMGQRAEELGIDPEEFPHVDDFNAFPTWRDPTMWDSPDEYDLTAYTGHQIEHKQTRTDNNKLLNELAPAARIRMNTETAHERGIEHGDPVIVESHDAMTGETHRLEGHAMVREGFKKGTVGIPASHGGSKDPVSDRLDEGAHANEVFVNGPGYMNPDTGQSFHVRVKVMPKEGDDG